MDESFYQNDDNLNDINEFDKIFFKVAFCFGLLSVIIYSLLTLFLVITKSMEGVSALKLSIYLFLLVIFSLIIIMKSFNLLNVVKKRTKHYVTGFFLIFFPLITLYFILGIHAFLATYLWIK